MITAALAALFLGPAHLDAAEPVDRSSARCEGEVAASLAALIDDHDALLVGEMHGTAEMPAMLTTIVRLAAERKERVVVALEYEAEDQAAIDAFAHDPDAPFPFDTRDGRSSGAMADMLRDVAAIAQASGTVSVAAVDTWPERGTTPYQADWLPSEIDKVQSQRDIGMGQLAVAACEAQDCDLLVYYAGNMHTRRQPATGGFLDRSAGGVRRYLAAPAGYVIDHDLPAVSIKLVHRGGVLTAKMGPDGRLAERPIRPSAPEYAAADGVPYCAGSSAVYDYVLSVGTITSSSKR